MFSENICPRCVFGIDHMNAGVLTYTLSAGAPHTHTHSVHLSLLEYHTYLLSWCHNPAAVDP